MNKQIEEMTKDLKENLRLFAGVKLFDHDVEIIAYQLCKKYQPKLPEDSVVMTSEELIERYVQEHEWASQETAREILCELIKRAENISFFDCRMGLDLDELAKQYGVEVE